MSLRGKETLFLLLLSGACASPDAMATPKPTAKPTATFAPKVVELEPPVLTAPIATHRPETATPADSLLDLIRQIAEQSYPDFNARRILPERVHMLLTVTAPRGLNVRSEPNKAERETILTTVTQGTEFEPSARILITFPDEHTESWFAVMSQKLRDRLQTGPGGYEGKWVFMAEDVGDGPLVAPVATPTPGG